MVVHEYDGVRIVMGTHDRNEWDKPDIDIERRPHGWAVCINAHAGDPVAWLYILDDGRTFLMPDKYADLPLEVVNNVPSELDAL